MIFFYFFTLFFAFSKPTLAKNNQWIQSFPTEKSKDFPELDCLKPNVHFWKQIYDKIPQNQALIHDRYDLDRVYGSVNLTNSSFPRSLIQQWNQAKMQDARQYYSEILKSLAKKSVTLETLTDEEIQIASMFPAKERRPSFYLDAVDGIRIQTGLKEEFAQGLERSLLFLPLITQVLKNNRVPLDLAYLPHVESSFNPTAGSKVGAKGLWQLMPQTMTILMGRGMELRRHEPLTSTKAAVKLLMSNYEKTKSWPLALTAYNHGVNGVLKAIDSVQTRDLCKIIGYYEAPSFKFASSNFYAQFLAAREVASKHYHELKKKEDLTNEKLAFKRSD